MLKVYRLIVICKLFSLIHLDWHGANHPDVPISRLTTPLLKQLHCLPLMRLFRGLDAVIAHTYMPYRAVNLVDLLVKKCICPRVL